IALCCAKAYIVQLKGDILNGSELPNLQRGVKGHVIIYPQKANVIAKKLPSSIEDIVMPICVLFVGSTVPSKEWLQKKAKLLAICGDRVWSALLWLKEHNPLYQDIELDESALDELDQTSFLPFHIEHVLPSQAQSALQSWYDTLDHKKFTARLEAEDIPFQNVVITDVDGHASSNELTTIRHVKQKGGGYLQISHDPNPVNEFNNPALFPMIYLTLCPYSLGGFEDHACRTPLLLKAHVKHLLSLCDCQFQQHPSFLFSAFNILQQRAVLLQTSLKVKHGGFLAVAQVFATIFALAVYCVAEHVVKGNFVTATDDDRH
ncbi:hypothetical protein L208DRAFT_1261635, partial [Tricholoma matsutake]